MYRNFCLLTFLFLASTLLVNAQDYTVLFKTSYTPEPNIMSTQDRILFQENEVINNNVYRYIQFEKPLLESDHQKIKDLGIEFLNFIPYNTYLASIPVGTDGAILRKVGARSVWKPLASQKAGADVVNRSLPEWAIQGNQALLLVEYPQNIERNQILQLCAANDIEVTMSNEYNNFLEISVSLNNLETIIELPFLSGVDAIPPPPVKDDKLGRSLHRMNRLNSNLGGISGYTGAGVSVLVRDDGRVFDHIDFTGRIDQQFVGPSNGSHGDGVAGILAGAGNLDPDNLGMAIGSQIYVVDYVSNFLDETMDLHIDNGVLVTNSSYSDFCNAGYTFTTNIVDQQIYQNPTLLHVFSAGNDGESDCGYGAGNLWGNITGGHKMGKNAMTVANLNFRGEVVNSSSRGPATDGRIKPDIAANGFNHISTDEFQGYMSFGGTSAAAPVVAGATAVLHEVYKSTHGSTANSALLKAIMLNTANEAGNKGPDFIYGWGILNGHRAAKCIEEGRFLNGTIGQGDTRTHTIEVPADVAEVRIMTYWPERNGTTTSIVHLLNDLNTSVEENGNQHLPWVLDPTPDPAILALPATKGVDDRNNMEQVSIDNPTPGTYTLTISGDQVPVGPADYYVVWEFGGKGIDLTYPNGGENFAQNDAELFRWDTEGDEGEFLIEIIDEAGEVVDEFTAAGDARAASWNTGNAFNKRLKARISRDGFTDESDDFFLVASRPRELEINIVDGIPMLEWIGHAEAVDYNIYVLGDRYMEKVTTNEGTSFIIPDEDIYKNTWVAVSANFEDGIEGKRTVAITSALPPVAMAINDFADMPCQNIPITFQSVTDEPGVEYTWVFGGSATPGSATGPGPHQVTYATLGVTVGFLSVSSAGGNDNAVFTLDVQPAPQGSTISFEEINAGEFTFTSDAANVETYSWDFGDGETGEGEMVMHTFSEDGLYTVVLTASSPCGDLVISQDVQVGPVGVEDLVTADFKVVPNPNNGSFQIDLPDMEGNDLSIQLISIDGRVIEEKEIFSATAGMKINYDNISPGFYILKFRFEGNTVASKVEVR